jgi:hypothetical protein
VLFFLCLDEEALAKGCLVVGEKILIFSSSYASCMACYLPKK